MCISHARARESERAERRETLHTGQQNSIASFPLEAIICTTK